MQAGDKFHENVNDLDRRTVYRLRISRYSYLDRGYMTLPTANHCAGSYKRGRYTVVNHTRDIFLISLSYTWTTEE